MTTSRVALLRGINVSGRNKLPMVELRALCSDIGWTDVRTYIQSGNLVFKAAGTASEEATFLEDAIVRRFGLEVPVVVRSASDWAHYVEGNPFLDACEKEPNLVMLALSKTPPGSDAAARLAERASDGERVMQVDDALWIHFGSGVARSRLSPGLLDRVVGSAVTTRNWRTVLKIHELVADRRR